MGLKAVIVVPVFNPVVIAGVGITTVPSQPGITIVEVNSTLGLSTIKLPPTPAIGQIVIVQDAGNDAATNNITVQGNGNNINVPNLGAEASVTIAGNGEDFWFNWLGATFSAWGILA